MKLWTTEIGDGPKRAALLHGITGDGGTWFEVAPWLAEQGYTVTLVDQRGHGRSPRAASYRPAEFADDLVDTLPIGLDLLVGHSLGGLTLSLAVERLLPERAVYLDPAWLIPDDLVIPLPVDDDGALLTADELALLAPHVSRAHVENALRAVALFDRTVLDVPLGSAPPAAGPPVVPSLVLLADPSPLVTPELRERLIRDGYSVVVIPGGQHDLHVTDLTETLRVLGDWIRT